MKKKLKVLSPNHLIPFLIFFLAMYISTGKYTANGQNPRAPKRASISLKKGIAMAITVNTTTSMLLQTTLKKLSLNFTFPMLIGYSLLTKLDLAHLSLAHVSTTVKMGWITTCQNYSFKISTLKQGIEIDKEKESITNKKDQIMFNPFQYSFMYVYALEKNPPSQTNRFPNTL